MTLRSTSLHTKLAVVLLGLFLVVGGITLVATIVTSHLYQQEVQQRIHHDLAAHIAAEEQLIEGGAVEEAAVKDLFHMMMVINPTIELYLLDPEGRILAFSAPPGRVTLTRVSLGPIRSFFSGTARLPILGDDPRHPERRNIFSVAPISSGGRLEGYLYVVLASERFVGVADLLRGSFILRIGATAVAGSVVLALLGAVILSWRLTRPLSGLSRDMARFEVETLNGVSGAGEEKDPSSPSDQDELARLRTTFDRMAARIGEQVRELEKQDRLRREMVANVSHDLRTPLSHLQGYLETLMLKRETLSGEERREYLEIALAQSERLGRLVSDLFELAKLEALDEPLDCERLPVGELVQDVTQKYLLSARDRGVILEADLAGGVEWITADVRLLERALENILDNALRHTQQGGRISVAIHPHDQWLQIEVRDTGSGIEASELPLIFERFHRSGSSEDDVPGRGAGLGLAIARRAVELHGGRLSCESQLGHGTTFRFQLPASPG